MVQNNLLKNSIAAYFAAVEIHNKPNFSYRYKTTTLLLMNAWESVPKAFIKKYIKSKNIFTKDGHMISIDKAIDYTEECINTLEPKSFTAIKENLLIIEEYRNNIFPAYKIGVIGWSDGYSFVPVAFNLLSSAEKSNRYNEGSTKIDKRTNGYKLRKESRLHKPQYRYVYGAVEPLSGENFFLVLSQCDTVNMNVFLEYLSKQYEDDIIF